MLIYGHIRSTPQASWGQRDNWSCEAVPTKTTNKTRRELVAFSGDGRTYMYIIYIYTYRCRDLSQVHHPGKIDEKPGRKLNFWVDFLKFLWTSRCSRCTSSRFLAWISTHRMVDVTTEYWPQGQGAETDGWSGSGEFTIKLSLWYLQGGPGP